MKTLLKLLVFLLNCKCAVFQIERGIRFYNQSGEHSLPSDKSSFQPALISLIACLALILFFLLVTLVLPIKVQNSVFFCCRRHDPGDIVNVDVGLYKTRHAIYRPEVYSTEMRRPWTNNAKSATNKTRNPRLVSHRGMHHHKRAMSEETSHSRKLRFNHFGAVDSTDWSSNFMQSSDHPYEPYRSNETKSSTNEEYTTNRPSISLPLFKFETVDEPDESVLLLAPDDRIRSVSCESNYADAATQSKGGNQPPNANADVSIDINPPSPTLVTLSKSDTNILYGRRFDCPQCLAELENLYEFQANRSGFRKPSSINVSKRSVSFVDNNENETDRALLS